ncbi:MAG: C2 family cysteine protease [Myxococcaceae bacterium]|jgi:hypothetical protein|nr:C2 family cysteine protease [Myxococcaceae bacterium]
MPGVRGGCLRGDFDLCTVALVRIRDPGVERVARHFEAKATTVPDRDVLELLAELGDRTPSEATALLAALSKPGSSRADQLALVQDGLDDDERSDVAELLDNVTVKLSPAARNLLEALVGRANLDVHAPGLQLDTVAPGALEGLAMPGAVVEAVNLSTAPTGFGRVTDAVELGRADAQGRFSVFMGDAQPGDVVRVRARGADGRATDWFTQVASDSRADPRAAFVNLKRVLLRSAPDGTVSILPASRSLPFTEPFATVRFTNQRTGESIDVRMGDHATLTAPVTLRGQPGDAIAVAVSDGGGNTDFAFVSGTLVAPGLPPRGAVADPDPVAGEGFSRFTTEGDLFVNGASGTDPKQGQIGNCYVPAGLAAVAFADPSAIDDLIRPNDDGTVTVRFFDAATLSPHEVVVDRELYGVGGRPRYGGATERDARGQGEAWFSLVEKAYATWKGSYDVVARGGSVGQLQAEVLGRPNVEHWLQGRSPDEVFQVLTKGQAERRAMSAGTFGSNEAARYTNTGLYANHAYSVVGVKDDGGQKLVTLRNPWASGEPRGDGLDDGVFDLPLDDFIRLFQVLNVT